MLLLLERATYAVADHVIATNESYRETAIERGGVPAERVTVVRTGPDPDRQRRGSPAPDWRCGKRYLCAYLGVMGPQDGVDLALRAAAAILRTGRDDVHFVFVGGGDSFDGLVALADELGIASSSRSPAPAASPTKRCSRFFPPPIWGFARIRSIR